MSEAASRAAVVAEAMTWLGTPYQHRQRLRGVAVDCAGLPLEVYAAVGLIPRTDVGEYSAQWHLHRGEEVYLGWVQRLGPREITAGEVQTGDFLVYRFGRTFSHGAIALDGQRVIHAVARARQVVIEDRTTTADLRTAAVRAFTFWG